MAIVILGGLVTATLVSLFVLPSLYLAFGKSRRKAEPEVSRSAGYYGLKTSCAVRRGAAPGRARQTCTCLSVSGCGLSVGPFSSI